MISFKKWLEVVAAAPAVASAATTSASVSGSPGATTSKDIAPFLRPVGSNVVRRQYPFRKKRKKNK
jgi:hypothetical protein